jgi:energy-coupling factor transport system permease protein
MFPSVAAGRRTALHGLDPRTKIVGFVLISGLLFVFDNPLYILPITLVLLLLTALGGCIRNLARAKYLLLLLFLSSFIAWQIYLRNGPVVVRLGPVALTRAGLLDGLTAALRIVSGIMAGTLFLATTGIEELTIGLVRLKVPYRLGFVVSLAARLVPTFVLTVTSIIQAQTARGLDLGSRNPLRRARRLIPVLIPFLMSSIRHASRLAAALESKGFRPGARRSYYLTIAMRPNDFAIILGLVMLTVGCIVFRLDGYGTILAGQR